jgi:starch synthase
MQCNDAILRREREPVNAARRNLAAYIRNPARRIEGPRAPPLSLRIAYTASEYAPLVKTGGLADVAGALPLALRQRGLDVRVVLPGFPAVCTGVERVGRSATIPALGRIPAADLVEVRLPSGVPGWIVENPALYDRIGGPYQAPSGHDWPDNPVRFGLLSYAAAWLAASNKNVGWTPDLLHANDWQTGLAPTYGALGVTKRLPSVFTVHNLAFQGVYEPEWTTDLGLPPDSFGMYGVEYHGRFSFLKAALFYADAITTVSPTYAREIQSASAGMGLQGLLADRRDVLTGILNGIDTATWNPADDKSLRKRYDASCLDGKAVNKRALQIEVGLEPDNAAILLGVVARLTSQKGIDLVADIAPSIAGLPGQLVVLGTGDPALEQRLRDLHASYPGQIAAVIGFDEGLAHRIEAGCDAFVMPSRFEPCGLNQMYSQRYGTPPIVHATGGLSDSVIDASVEAIADNTATGFTFQDATAEALAAAVRRALGLYRERPLWHALQRNGMARDFGWTQPAAAYADVYVHVLRRSGAA